MLASSLHGHHPEPAAGRDQAAAEVDLDLVDFLSVDSLHSTRVVALMKRVARFERR